MKAGWQTRRLGDLIQLISGQHIDAKDYNTEGRGIGYLTGPSDFGPINPIVSKWTEYPKVKAQKGDILLTVKGSGVGKINLLDQDEVVISRQLMAIRVTGADLRFIYAFLSSAFDHFQAESTGAAIPGIAREQVLGLRITIPPLGEQQRIVGILDETLAGIAAAKANAEKNLQNVRALLESLVNVAIQGRLVAQDERGVSVMELLSKMERARNLAVENGKASPKKAEPREIGDERVELPHGWEWAQLESLTTSISDGVHKKPLYVPKGIPFVTVKDLTAGPGISFDDVKYITQKDHEQFIKRTHPEKGDILITKDGTLGVVRLVETDIDFSIFVSVALIKPLLVELGPYLVYALRSSFVQSQIVPQGAALQHLYLVDLRRLAIPLPPVADQKRIVSLLDVLSAETQRLESIYQRKLAALEELKQSLLHKAFTGAL